MAIYVFAYDLVKKKPEFDYEILWAELKRLGAHRVQESLWIVNLANSAKEVAEHFGRYMHSDDRIWVSSVRRGEHWYKNAMAGTNSWLEANPPT